MIFKLTMACVVGFIFGPCALVFGFRRLRTEIGSLRWVPAEAVITQSQIVSQYVGKGTNESIPIIEFEVRQNDAVSRHKADFFTVGNNKSAIAIISKYPLGASVVAFVNPRNPRQACLKRGVTTTSVFFTLLGLALFLVELEIFVFHWRDVSDLLKNL